MFSCEWMRMPWNIIGSPVVKTSGIVVWRRCIIFCVTDNWNIFKKKPRHLPYSVVQNLSLKSRHIPYASPHSVVKTCLVKVDTSKQQHINEDLFLKLSRVVRARQWMMRGGVKWGGVSAKLLKLASKSDRTTCFST